ncbi:MAG TPA: glycosyltransferase [Thermoanaerobaculia bacterium]
MLTIAIPTFQRGAVLCETIALLLDLDPPPGEIVIVDQTPEQPDEVAARLHTWHEAGLIRLIRLEHPSITRAMNVALMEAKYDAVLFLDDDVIPSRTLVAEHIRALSDASVTAVVGQVLQPGESPVRAPEANLHRGLLPDLEFPFNHDAPSEIENVMAGNLAVDRDKALAIGGFDENFVGVAYRFETDFARRLVAAGARIRYEPAASIRHLKAPGGGTRTFGDHRTSTAPWHSVGDYYFALLHAPRFWRYAAHRLLRNTATRFHLTHPWTLPGKLIGELRGMMLARKLATGGRKLMRATSERDGK